MMIIDSPRDLLALHVRSAALSACTARRSTAAAVLGLLLTGNAAASQTREADTIPLQSTLQSPRERTAHALRLRGELNLDGRLNEPEWEGAEVMRNFTQSYPDPGAKPSRRTEVRMLYDDQALYVGARMYDTDPSAIAAPLARYDATGIYSDWIHVIVDSYHDHRTAFRFSVNPRGVKKDVLQFNDINEDLAWGAVWEVATTTDSLGWVAEYRIPFSQLRFHPFQEGEEQAWGLQLMRDIARYNERDSWAPWTQQSPGFVSSFGDLAGLRDVPSPQRLEILPYIRALLTRAPGDPGDPFYQQNDVSSKLGVDFKYGLPFGLMLTGTINPDFGQVEVDPEVVNLTAFETFFPEKRPFFVEGAGIFNFGRVFVYNGYGNEQFFYSRRIGREPQRVLAGPDVLFADAPVQTTILGAAKVSGKVGPWTVGFIDAITDEEEAGYATPKGEQFTTRVEPRANYLVGRLRRDFRAGNTILGGMITATNRATDDSIFGPLLHSSAYFGGVDFEHAWDGRGWILSGYLGGTLLVGRRKVIAATQRSSAHYYQRPDADYLPLDSTRTSLTGHIAEIALAKTGRWFGSLDYKQVSPGFHVNDLGFQGRSDYRSLAIQVAFQEHDPGRIFRNWAVFGLTNHVWNFGGDRILEGYGAGAQATLTNLWSTTVMFIHNPAVLSDRLTRGGPLAQVPSQSTLSLSVGSDPRKPFSALANTSYTRDASNGFVYSAGVSFDIRPSDAIRVQLGPSVSRNRSTSQYLLTAPDARADATYGDRYVFADLDQTTVKMDIRLDWTFTPDLSLQLYAQPFLSAGDYTDLKEFLAPQTEQFGVYGQDKGTICSYSNIYVVDPINDRACPGEIPAVGDPNFTIRSPDPSFNLRSLRGNAVLRWEYRPGSTLYFVWQQQRSAFYPLGTFDFGRDAGALFRAPATNVFLIKLTYWFGL